MPDEHRAPEPVVGDERPETARGLARPDQPQLLHGQQRRDDETREVPAPQIGHCADDDEQAERRQLQQADRHAVATSEQDRG